MARITTLGNQCVKIRIDSSYGYNCTLTKTKPKPMSKTKELFESERDKKTHFFTNNCKN
jgi:hypothetical protein